MFTGGSNDDLGLAGGAAAAAADEDGAYRYCDDGDDEILERAFIDVILRRGQLAAAALSLFVHILLFSLSFTAHNRYGVQNFFASGPAGLRASELFWLLEWVELREWVEAVEWVELHDGLKLVSWLLEGVGV